ncbi:MAG: Mut7-C RNAse domain-containing protein, partial [Bacteroidota bacterium]
MSLSQQGCPCAIGNISAPSFSRFLISVYPYFYNIKLPEGYKLQEEYSGKAKFILDVHLGKLARFLRRFNFDTSYSNNYSDREIVETAEKENRIILTRDLGILMRKKVKWGCFIKY